MLQTKKIFSVKKLLAMLLTMATLATTLTAPVHAGIPKSDLACGVESMKITSSVIEEENYIDVQVTYRAVVENFGWTTAYKNPCGSCGGAGRKLRYGGASGEAAGAKPRRVSCGESIDGYGVWMCRDECDGTDYMNPTSKELAAVVYPTPISMDEVFDGTYEQHSYNSWEGKGIFSKPYQPCTCHATIVIQPKKSSGAPDMVACRGCKGTGKINLRNISMSCCQKPTCNKCHGSGSYSQLTWDECDECKGKGQVSKYLPCNGCGGAGFHEVTVTTPAITPPSQVTANVKTWIQGETNKYCLEKKGVVLSVVPGESINENMHKKFVYRAVVDFHIWTGKGIGDKKVETEIEFEGGKDNEVLPIKVKPACDLNVKFYNKDTNGDSDGKVLGDIVNYFEGSEVITSFSVFNDNKTLGLSVRPSHKMQVKFKAETMDGKVIETQTKNNVVVPENKKSLVYFKWRLPKDVGSTEYDAKSVKLTCTVNTTGSVNETDKNNNSVSIEMPVKANIIYETYDTDNGKKAYSFMNLDLPKEYDGQYDFATRCISSEAIWSENHWQQNNNGDFEKEWADEGSYDLKKYKVDLGVNSGVACDDNVSYQDLNKFSNKYKGDLERMRAGYGIHTKVQAKLETQTKGAFTAATAKDMTVLSQHANAYFPEMNYWFGSANSSRYEDVHYRGNESGLSGKFRTDFNRLLERTKNGDGNKVAQFEFRENDFSTRIVDNNTRTIHDWARVHYTPIFYPDTHKTGFANGQDKFGKERPYEIVTYVYDAWTPAGQLSYRDTKVPGIEIKGTLHDDWYVSEEVEKIKGKHYDAYERGYEWDYQWSNGNSFIKGETSPRGGW